MANTIALPRYFDDSTTTEIKKPIFQGVFGWFTVSRKVEKPSNYLLTMLQKTSKQKAEGEVSPMFDNAEDAIKWLNS